MLPARRADITRVDLRPDEPGYAERLAGHLRALIDDPLVREAICVSSSSLASTLDKISQGRLPGTSQLERAVFATTRYLLRMCTRPTPFGLLAGVAIGTFDNEAKVRIGGEHTKSVEVDAGRLSALVEELQRHPDVRRDLRVSANDLCVVRGDRLVLTYVNCAPEKSVQPRDGASVRYTPPCPPPSSTREGPSVTGNCTRRC
jgi:hypothetical protein